MYICEIGHWMDDRRAIWIIIYMNPPCPRDDDGETDGLHHLTNRRQKQRERVSETIGTMQIQLSILRRVVVSALTKV